MEREENMDFAESVGKSKQLRDILFGQPSDCKHCCAVSTGVFGAHYACMNKNRKGYGMNPPLCFSCEGYEKGEQATTEQ